MAVGTTSLLAMTFVIGMLLEKYKLDGFEITKIVKNVFPPELLVLFIY